jgi:two-component system sensor kinase FixL
VNELIGKSFLHLRWLAESNETKRSLTNAINAAAAGKSSRIAQVRFGAGESAAVYDIGFGPMHDETGGVSHVILSAVDITEQKSIEDQAREQQTQLAHLERVQTMGHIASGLAHELNQPLGAIVNYAAAFRQMTAAGKMDAAKLADGFDDIIGEAARAGEIIRRLRSFVQKQQPQPSGIDLNTVVNESMRMLAFDLRQARIELELNLESNLPPTFADSIQITQVLINLIRNALDAMQDDAAGPRRLVVTSRSAGADNVRVSISDSGPGIGDTEIHRLFDAFYTTKSNGLGIGLALCRMIIERHGGQIAASRNAQRGMTFAFTLRTTPTGSDKD